MYKNCKGFILLDTVVAINIIILFTLVIIPVYIIMKQEKQSLHERMIISLYLFNQMQTVIRDEITDITNDEEKMIGNKTVNFTYTLDEQFIKGCAIWDNYRKRRETFCLYGLSER